MSDLPPFDPYDVLGVDKDADPATIKKAYRKLALIKHPDKCVDEELKQLRTDEFQRLNEAYDIIGDEENRKRHNAMVKLEALRKEKFSMGGPPRPFTRAATFQNAYPSSKAYTSRGATNVEDRVPNGFYEDEVRYQRRSSADHDYARRSAGGTARPERTARTDRDDDRRKKERKRDETVRDARSRKYEDSDVYPERDWKREEPSRSKYDGWEETLNAYTNKAAAPRPSMDRRTSSREVPQNNYATRSRAAPKEGRAAREDRDILEAERELQREKERLARLREDRRARDEEKERREEERLRRYEQDRAAEKEARRKQEREAERWEAEKREADQEQREREARTRRRENVEPFERRPPQLQHNHTSPPVFPEVKLPRSRTDPVTSDSVPHPSMSRSSTMPSVPISNSSARRTATGPSKLRESTLQPDSGYSSNSSTERASRSNPAKPVRVTNHYYPSHESGRSYTVETHEPGAARPSMERASSKMANLAKHAVRPAPSAGTYSYSLPTRPRSPERSSRREREYARSGGSASRPLFGERTPSYDPDSVKWSKPITEESISYTRPAAGGSSSSRRERDAYPYSSPRFDRRSTSTVQPMQQ